MFFLHFQFRKTLTNRDKYLILANLINVTINHQQSAKFSLPVYVDTNIYISLHSSKVHLALIMIYASSSKFLTFQVKNSINS